MVYEKDIIGKFVTLRSITIDDAEFSYCLRKDPRFIDIMGQPAESVEAQKKYIEWQRNEPGDYYFVVLNKIGERIGLIGVYNIQGDTCEFGRELNIGEPYETMEAEILNLDFARGVLGIKNSKSIIYKHNYKQFNMLKKRGESKITEIIHNGIPSYLMETTTEEINVGLESARKMIDKLAKKMTVDNLN